MPRQWFIVRTDSPNNIDPNRLHNAIETLADKVEVVEMPEADQAHFNTLVELNDARKAELGYPTDQH